MKFFLPNYFWGWTAIWVWFQIDVRCPKYHWLMKFCTISSDGFGHQTPPKVNPVVTKDKNVETWMTVGRLSAAQAVVLIKQLIVYSLVLTYCLCIFVCRSVLYLMLESYKSVYLSVPKPKVPTCALVDVRTCDPADGSQDWQCWCVMEFRMAWVTDQATGNKFSISHREGPDLSQFSS